MKSNMKRLYIVGACCVMAGSCYKYLPGSVKHLHHQVLRALPKTFGKTHYILGATAADMGQAGMQDLSSEHEVVYPDKQITKAYFSPDENLQHKLIRRIEQEKAGIKLAIYSFTDKQIADALIQAHSNGIAVEVVADHAFLSDRYTKIAYLHEHGIPIYIYDPKRSPRAQATYSNIMHHKFVIFERNKNDVSWVWTGSFNFTKSARLNNQENVLLLNDPTVVRRYNQQFNRLKQRAMRYQ